MTWNEKVISLLFQKGWNQKRLAEKSGITEASVSRYLRGDRSPRMDIIVNFSKALNVTTEYLLNDDNETCLNAYTDIATAIARSGTQLTSEEKNKLIALILRKGDE